MYKQRKNKGMVEYFLANLVLWCNDPRQVRSILALAVEGQQDAQYALSLMYAEGRGVELDEVAAYFWLTKAMSQGDADAETLRQIVQQSMSLEQIAQAERRLNQNKF